MNCGFLSYFIKPQQYSMPVNWHEIFQTKGKLAVEIGFGSGEFLVSLAKAQKGYNFIGFETSITSLVRIQKRIHSESLRNVRVVLADGRFGLREFFADNSVDQVYTNFPCPWPKKSHEGKRFTNQGFAETLAAVLTLGGIYQLVTDVQWYAEQMRDVLLSTGSFELLQFNENNDIVVGTRYERKWLSEGRKTYTLLVSKVVHKTVERWTWEDGSMPHVHLNKADMDKLLALAGMVFKHDKGVFVVKRIYNCHEGEYLLRMVSNEDGFQQRYFISVEREKDGWLVKLDPDALAYRTPVVKFSVKKIAEVIGS
ncbi:MAG: tRNA (guanosine(46)-N7)-methyltransferase TrmB [Pseudothermotoga sp.]